MPDFSHFDNPIIWLKQQLDDNPLPVNFQGNILPPFFDAQRFNTQLAMPARGQYNPLLTIAGQWYATSIA